MMPPENSRPDSLATGALSQAMARLSPDLVRVLSNPVTSALAKLPPQDLEALVKAAESVKSLASGQTGTLFSAVSPLARGELASPAPDASSAPLKSPADLGALVRAARKAAGLDQQGLADLAGVGRRFISELENGKPTLELGKVLTVAAALGIDLFARKR